MMLSVALSVAVTRARTRNWRLVGPVLKGAKAPASSIVSSRVLGTVPPTTVPGASPSALELAAAVTTSAMPAAAMAAGSLTA